MPDVNPDFCLAVLELRRLHAQRWEVEAVRVMALREQDRARDRKRREREAERAAKVGASASLTWSTLVAKHGGR